MDDFLDTLPEKKTDNFLDTLPMAPRKQEEPSFVDRVKADVSNMIDTYMGWRSGNANQQPDTTASSATDTGNLYGNTDYEQPTYNDTSAQTEQGTVWSNLRNDVSQNIVQPFVTGAGQAWDEYGRARQQQDAGAEDLARGIASGNPSEAMAAAGQVSDNSAYVGKAFHNLNKSVSEPLVMGGAMVPGPHQAILGPMAAGMFVGDVTDDVVDEGPAAAIRNNTYGPIKDWASQDNLGVNALERPISTLGQGAMAALPAAIGGKMVYRGVKTGLGHASEYDTGLNALDESIAKAPQATNDSFLDILPDAHGSNNTNSATTLGDNVFNCAVEKTGMPYELGGDGISSTDCGKLVQDSFNSAGVEWNNRYVPSMIAEAEEKGAWHPAGDGYIPQKGDGAVVLGDNHIILSDGEGGYIGANSSSGVIKKTSIADDFGDVTGYISVNDMSGGRRTQPKDSFSRTSGDTGAPRESVGGVRRPAEVDTPEDYSPAKTDVEDSGDTFGRDAATSDNTDTVINQKAAVEDPPINYSMGEPEHIQDFKKIPLDQVTQADLMALAEKELEYQKLIPSFPADEVRADADRLVERAFQQIAPQAPQQVSQVPQTPGREFSKAPIESLTPIQQEAYEYGIKRLNEMTNNPELAIKPAEQMRGVNEELLNKAYEASDNSDYRTAAELARKAGAPDWAKQFELLDRTAGGEKPVEPRLSGAPSGEYTGDTVTMRQIVKRASDLFVPIRTGRIGKAGVMGFADHNSGVIRTRNYGDLGTMSHEIGHITDAALGLRGESGAFDPEFRRVVEQRFGKGAYDDAQIRSEGIAEFMHDYLTNESRAKAEMPGYYDHFKAALEKDPDVKTRLNEVKSMIDTWNGQSPEARGRSAVSYADEMKPTLKEKASGAKLKFVENWVDDKVGLKRVTESYEKATGQHLKTKDDPYKMARLAQNSSVSRAQMLVEGDRPELVKSALNKVYGNIIDNGVTIKSILKDLDADPELKGRQNYLTTGNFKNWHEALDSLLVARRQAELQTIYPDYKGPMGRKDAEAIIKQAPKALNDAAQKVYTYNDNILRILKENGMIKPEVYDALTDKYHNYVPMARDFTDEAGLEKGFGMSGKGFGNVRAALKSISGEGSTRQVVSPLESIVKNTYAMLNLVERNRVGQTFVKMAEGDRTGKLIEEVSGTANTKDSTFSVWVNGEKKVYQTEPEIYRAIMSVNKDTANIITQLLSPPAQLLRAGATLMPDFAVKNIVRDSFGAAVFSRYGFIPVVDHMAGIFHMAKQDALFHEYKASGALMSTMVGMDRNYIQGSLKGLYKKDVNYYWDRYNPVQVLRGFSEMLETATRLGEYGRAVGKGVSIEDAALSARDISLDFSKHGVQGKTANKVIAFFNAGVQEPARIIQAFKENPKGTAAKIAMFITLPSIALWSMNYNQQWYKELPDYQKNLFWCFKAGDTVYRVPKPFGLGVVFGSLPERIADQVAPYILSALYPEHALEYMAQKNPNGMKAWASSAKDAFLPNFMPTAVGPIIEWATNYSFFRGRSIVPQKEQKLPDALQFGDNTSELAKYIGAKFDMSPRKIDNLISGYGAGMANQSLNAMDAAVGKKDYQNPFSKAFTVDPMKSPQSIQDFYDKLDETQKIFNGSKLTKQKMSKDDFYNYNLMNYANGMMSYLNKMEQNAVQNGDKDKADSIRRQQLKTAQNAMAKVR